MSELISLKRGLLKVPSSIPVEELEKSLLEFNKSHIKAIVAEEAYIDKHYDTLSVIAERLEISIHPVRDISKFNVNSSRPGQLKKRLMREASMIRVEKVRDKMVSKLEVKSSVTNPEKIDGVKQGTDGGLTWVGKGGGNKINRLH